MAQETEITILDIDKDTIITTLENMGAENALDTRLFVDWYRPAGLTEGEEPWYLRIRSNSAGEHEVTWKAKSDEVGRSRQHKEINFTVSDPTEVASLFSELGLEHYAHQEKDRISYVYNDWRFDIDTYPGMPPYIEIEGTNNAHIEEAMNRLGVAAHRTWNKGERLLIQEEYGIDWYHMSFTN